MKVSEMLGIDRKKIYLDEMSITRIDSNDLETTIPNEVMDDVMFLYLGHSGEKVIANKATVSDGFAWLSALVIAISVSSLFSADASNFHKRLNFQLFLLSTSSATSFGFMALFSFTFITSKIKRLLGKTLHLFGESIADVEHLKTIHGKEKWRNLKENHFYAEINEVRFPARQWYYHEFHSDRKTRHYGTDEKPPPSGSSRSIGQQVWYRPNHIFAAALRCFHIMCVFCVLSIIFKVYDSVVAASSSSAATDEHSSLDTLIGWICVAILAAGVAAPLYFAHANKSMYDLH